MDAARFRDLVQCRLDEIGQSPITAARRAGLPRDAIRSVFRGHPPSLERAAQIAAALGYELVIRPRGAVSDTSPEFPSSVSRIRETDPQKKSAAEIPPPGSAWEPVPDRGIAEILAALADEYEALDAHGRESLRLRFWGLNPDLRERADRRAGRRLARLAGGGG